MLRKIWSWFKKPYPIIDTLYVQLGITFLMGFSVFIFLAIFQPFNLSDIQPNKLLIVSGYGFITFFTSFIISAAVLLIPFKLFDPESWTVIKNIIMIFCAICLITIANWWYTRVMGKIVIMEDSTLFSFVGFTFSIAFVPVLVLTYFTEMWMRKKNVKKADNLSRKIADHAREPADYLITIDSDSKNERFQILCKDLLYMLSEGNYVNVYFYQENKLSSRLIRSSMKKQSDVLSDYDSVIRCHRFYIINLEKVTKISGNARGYFLHLSEKDVVVPVSRAMSKKVLSKLQDINS